MRQETVVEVRRGETSKGDKRGMSYGVRGKWRESLGRQDGRGPALRKGRGQALLHCDQRGERGEVCEPWTAHGGHPVRTAFLSPFGQEARPLAESPWWKETGNAKWRKRV